MTGVGIYSIYTRTPVAIISAENSGNKIDCPDLINVTFTTVHGPLHFQFDNDEIIGLLDLLASQLYT